jgi:copper chaperone CopZ
MRFRIALAFLLPFAALAADQSVRLKIPGWHSSGDAYKTEVAVRAVKGVRSASADRASGTLGVVFDDAVAKREQIEKAVQDAGYSVAR